MFGSDLSIREHIAEYLESVQFYFKLELKKQTLSVQNTIFDVEICAYEII